jgi:hypothetical protein
MIEEEVPPYRKPGNWVLCGIVGLGFPREPREFQFRGRTLYLLPGVPKGEKSTTGDLYPVVALEHTGMTFEDGQRLISAFINGIAWVRRAPILTAQFGGGSYVHGLGGPDAKAMFDDRFELNYVPDPDNDRASLALAFYREGLTLNSAAYQCLSFFKVLNISIKGGAEQVAWINANIEDARKKAPYQAQDWEVNAGFKASEQSPGQYLYLSNRCAVAHAFNDPLIDPDDPDDRRRLANDLPIVKALAEHFIEQEFGVKSAMSVWREHLYELAGFKELFGPDLLTLINSEEEVAIGDFPVLPPLSVRLAFHNYFSSFENLNVEILDCANHIVNLGLSSHNGLVSIVLVLDFGAERLNFDVFYHMAVENDGSVAGIKVELDWLRFVDSYLLNGKIEIWAAKQRLSRKDSYIPENIDLGATHKDYQKRIIELEARLHTLENSASNTNFAV